MKANLRWVLFEDFSRLALRYPDTEICNLYNDFARNAEKEDKPFIAENFSQFIRTAENARKAPSGIKELIMRG